MLSLLFFWIGEELTTRNYIILSSIVFGDGGFFNGTSSGKKNLEASFTLNPYSYFPQGQTYSTISYGLTKKIDLHAYYSITKTNYLIYP